MFVLFLIAAPAVEVFVFVEVGLAIGWLPATLLLLASSLLGVWLVRIEGRAAIERLALAVSERRPPGRAAVDGALGFLGGVLLALPGFLTAVLGALLVLPPTRALTRRWISRRYGGRAMRFVASAGRFTSPSRERGMRPADVDSTAVEDDHEQLGA